MLASLLILINIFRVSDWSGANLAQRPRLRHYVTTLLGLHDFEDDSTATAIPRSV
jgi:hypothetical protein